MVTIIYATAVEKRKKKKRIEIAELSRIRSFAINVLYIDVKMYDYNSFKYNNFSLNLTNWRYYKSLAVIINI